LAKAVSRTVDMNAPPDIVLLASDRNARAPLRAQLIEDGLEVIATDSWPSMREHLRPGAKPRLAIVDLHGLENPHEVLDGLRVLMKPGNVLLIGALGSIAAGALDGTGFRVLPRPVSIEEIVRAARAIN
jgi:DNA-binding NtrC family response regulator